ncbi:hypothetical protein Pyn_27444 [Prunus yedoensis var. nudiflora]|uniref:Uncharacterized protein n=1 Tax=Prunus yedoensis var. nudiflora TaxID=2094558 RepID=A0A314XVL6_PRUYE|nr:hypothetical protein Pyn_27444 [Prunus yedoensis var. nudiflora]
MFEGEVADVEHAVDFRGKTGIDLAKTDCAHIGCGVFGDGKLGESEGNFGSWVYAVEMERAVFVTPWEC